MNILEARRRVLGGEVYKKTAEGNPVSVRSLARMCPGLSIMGKSTQQTTTGANLFDRDKAIENSALGWTTGDPVNEVLSLLSDHIEVEPGNYSLNYCAQVFLYDSEKSFIRTYNGQSSNNKNFVIDEGTSYVRLGIRSAFNGNQDMTKATDIMLNSGSTALPWEPYTGGQPSPSPDYPQEIHSAGEDGSIQVDVFGGNLFDLDSTGTYYDNFNNLNAKSNQKLYIMIETTNGTSQMNYRFRFADGTKGADTNIVSPNESNGVHKKVITLNDDITGIAFYSTDMENIRTVSKVMVAISDTELPYKPYKQPQSLTVQTPNGLPGIPVTSGGNYTDENGQQWICDEIDFKRGKYVQRIKKYFPSEQSSYINNGALGEDAQTILVRYNTRNNNNKFINVLMCNFLSNTIISWTQDKEGYQYSADGLLDFRIEKIRLSEVTLDGVKQYCSEIGAYFYYAINDPILIDLSEEQMQAYVNLHTNRPTTVVSATDDAGIKLTYKTKKSLEVTD